MGTRGPGPARRTSRALPLGRRRARRARPLASAGVGVVVVVVVVGVARVHADGRVRLRTGVREEARRAWAAPAAAPLPPAPQPRRWRRRAHDALALFHRLVPSARLCPLARADDGLVVVRAAAVRVHGLAGDVVPAHEAAPAALARPRPPDHGARVAGPVAPGAPAASARGAAARAAQDVAEGRAAGPAETAAAAPAPVDARPPRAVPADGTPHRPLGLRVPRPGLVLGLPPHGRHGQTRVVAEALRVDARRQPLRRRVLVGGDAGEPVEEEVAPPGEPAVSGAARHLRPPAEPPPRLVGALVGPPVLPRVPREAQGRRVILG